MTSPIAQEKPKPKPRRWWRVIKRVAITLIIIAVVLVFGVFPYWMASVVTTARTRSMDRQLTDTPASYGAQYRDVEFQTGDGVRLSGWLLPSRGKGVTIIYSHGLFRSRRELLQRAVDMWGLGYGALLYDARNHGESGPATVSLGYFEKQDVVAAIQYLRESEKSADSIVLYGISLGAVTALRAAAETPEVKAVVSDSAFLSFEDTTNHHVSLFLRLPAFPLANVTRYFIERRAGFDGAQLSAVEAVKNLGSRPAMFIAGQSDKRMPPDIARRLYEASQSPKRDLLIVDADQSNVHGHAYQAAPALYVSRVDQFLKSAIGN